MEEYGSGRGSVTHRTPVTTDGSENHTGENVLASNDVLCLSIFPALFSIATEKAKGRFLLHERVAIR